MWGLFITRIFLVNMTAIVIVQAYDVHAESPAGHIHFQVLMPEDADLNDALANADEYLKFAKDAKVLSCAKTGSTQGATEEQKPDLEKNGCFIYKVHGCPEDKPAEKPEPATSE